MTPLLHNSIWVGAIVSNQIKQFLTALTNPTGAVRLPENQHQTMQKNADVTAVHNNLLPKTLYFRPAFICTCLSHLPVPVLLQMLQSEQPFTLLHLVTDFKANSNSNSAVFIMFNYLRCCSFLVRSQIKEDWELLTNWMIPKP